MIKIGDVIGGREIYAIHNAIIYNNQYYCLAKARNADTPEPFVVWNVDADGEGVNSGRYFAEQIDAEWEYAKNCFYWIGDFISTLDFYENLMKKDAAPVGEAPEREDENGRHRLDINDVENLYCAGKLVERPAKLQVDSLLRG